MLRVLAVASLAFLAGVACRAMAQSRVDNPSTSSQPATTSSQSVALQTPPSDPRVAPGAVLPPSKGPLPTHSTVMDSSGRPIAADPLLILPPEQLTPPEVQKLQVLARDFGQLYRYRDASATLPAPEPGRVVFFGDSITDIWGRGKDAAPFFPGKPYYNRGIGGQTTAQMLVRYRQDVLNLKPAAVVILAGTNDLAGNTGVESMEDIEQNLRSMADQAHDSGIRVILASVLPVDDYAWRKGLNPAEKVRSLNAWMKTYCQQHGFTYLDYYTALATPAGAMKPGTARDGVHPTPEGYAIMAPLAQSAIDGALEKR